MAIPKKSLKLVPKEDDEQKAVFQWADLMSVQYPQLKSLYAIPNGGSRNVIEAAKLKATGTKAGVPDICLPVAEGGFHGAYFEIKRLKGGKVSDYQRDWLKRLRDNGYYTAVCYGADDTIHTIEAYLIGSIKANHTETNHTEGA